MVSLTPVNGEHPTVSKNSFKLHQTADHIYLENPIFKNASVLSLSSSDDTLKVSIGSIPDKGIEASHTIHGILGILHLSNSTTKMSSSCNFKHSFCRQAFACNHFQDPDLYFASSQILENHFCCCISASVWQSANINIRAG